MVGLTFHWDNYLTCSWIVEGPTPAIHFATPRKVCAHGANLTEKCRVIPAFVNQIPTEVGTKLQVCGFKMRMSQ